LQLVRESWHLVGVFTLAELTITGATHSYTNADRDPAYIALHFCGTCGCYTHWTALPIGPQGKVGVDMRLFVADSVAGVELRFSDGRAWNRRHSPGIWRDSILL
jgi:hypothetical protein